MFGAAGGIVLRQLRESDGDRLFAYRSDPAVARYQMWSPQSEHEVRALIAEQTAGDPARPGAWTQLAIASQSDDGLLGDCGIRLERDRPEAEFGVTIAPEYQRQGHATAAVRAILALLFDRYRAHRVYCSVDPRNVPSVKLLEGAGFRREAHFVESIWFKGSWVDDLIFGMLEREWRTR